MCLCVAVLCAAVWAVCGCVWLSLCVAVWLCVDGSISLDFLDGDPTVAVVADFRFENFHLV